MKKNAARSAAKVPLVVKSAARTLEILELFDELRQPANIVTISLALNYPQSSTSALLRSLVHLGYLTYDRRRREFFPTDRVALLGSWINPPLFEDAALPRLMRAIESRVDLGVLLAARNGDYAQYIHVLNRDAVMGSHIKLGMKRPLATSGVGLALLSAMRDADVRGIFHRINGQSRTGATVNISELLQQIGEVRKRGYAYSENRVVEGYGMLAIRLPPSATDQALVIGIGGDCNIIRKQQERLVAIVLQEFEHYLHRSPSEELDNVRAPWRLEHAGLDLVMRPRHHDLVAGGA